MTHPPTEVRAAQAAIVVSAVAFVALALLLPPQYFTPDEAKYLGLGLNILDGRGLHTDFGVLFLNHAPVWPLVLAVPQRLFGLEALTVGHVVNAVAGGLTILFTGLLAWRYRPAAGAVAAIGLLGFPYLLELSRSAGLDTPAVALTLAYLWVAAVALDRGSIRLGVLAGVLFGGAFLVKETALPFLPVPYLAALLGPVTVIRIGRVGAASLAATAVTMSWWFVLDAQQGGTVYRLGTPAWTLVPISVAVAALVVAGLAVGWLAARPRLAAGAARLDALVAHQGRAVLAWLGLGVWFGGQLVIYARAPKLLGAPLLRVAQLTDDLREYGSTLIIPIAFGVVGGALALLLVRRSQEVRSLLFTTIAGIPLVLLVLGIGETVRHYVASIAVLYALGAVGWVWVASRAQTRPAWRLTLALALLAAFALGQLGLPERRLVHAGLLAGGVAVAAVIGLAAYLRNRPGTLGRAASLATGTGVMLMGLLLVAGAVAGVSGARAGIKGDRERQQAAATIAGWVAANTDPSDVIALNLALGYETAVNLRGHEVVRITPQTMTIDAATPLGLRSAGGLAVTDPIRIGTVLRNVDQLGVYAAGELTDRITTRGVDLWIETEYLPADQVEGTTMAMLDAAKGFTRVKDWRFGTRKRQTVTVIYRVDTAAVSFPTDRVFADAAAIDDLARLLGEAGDATAAKGLAERLVAVPGDAEAQAALQRLETVAGGS